MAQAITVCAAFCDFRMAEGWGLVLSGAELEGPLKSRVHTLTESRDRYTVDGLSDLIVLTDWVTDNVVGWAEFCETNSIAVTEPRGW